MSNCVVSFMVWTLAADCEMDLAHVCRTLMGISRVCSAVKESFATSTKHELSIVDVHVHDCTHWSTYTANPHMDLVHITLTHMDHIHMTSVHTHTHTLTHMDHIHMMSVHTHTHTHAHVEAHLQTPAENLLTSCRISKMVWLAGPVCL